MSLRLYPLLFTPVYKDYVWGGLRIPRLYHRTAPPLSAYAESWEISDRTEGMSVIANGPLAGRTLGELMAAEGTRLAGCASRSTGFPLLVKLIDAKTHLSVQVHPDDDAANRDGAEAKTEMWYVLDAGPDSRLFAGLLPGTTPARLRAALHDAGIANLLRAVSAEKDMAVFVPGGRVHAIGAGCLLLEVQQNSNTTYRLCDWGRRDRNGRSRELHIEQALAAIRWHDNDPLVLEPEVIAGGDNPRRQIVRCPYFAMTSTDLARTERVSNDGRSFHALFVAEGSVRVCAGAGDATLVPGSTCLLPAALPEYVVEPVGSGPAKVLTVSLE